jgi:glycosyltransferase involved in cell wall biosynthesis
VEEWFDPDRIDGDHPLPSLALVIQRAAYTPALGRLIDRMHALGRPVIFDVDDLVFEPQLAAWHRGVANLPAHEQDLYHEGVRRYAATLQRCDHVLTTSPLPAELAARRGPTAHVLRNALGTEMLQWANELFAQRSERRERGDPQRIVLGYGSGTSTHDVDFLEAAPAVLDILSRCSHAELWIAGPLRLPPELEGFGPRVRRFGLLDWRGWLELAAQFDIALAPLEMGNVFCRAKSEIKFVEAGALGVPVVASRIDPFAAAIRHGENGLLCGTPPEWLDALEGLVADPHLRRRLGDNARQTVLRHYSPEARAAELGSLLPQLRAPVTVKVERMTSQDRFIPLTIHWLVSEPFAGSGGHTTIFRMIRHLVEFGHVCHIHMLPVNFMHGYTPAQIKGYVDEQFMRTGAVFHLWDGSIGPADATVATFWRTVPLLQRLPLPGRAYYLVQDYEPYFYPMGSEYIQAENTYRSGLHCLTVGPWLSELLHRQYGAEADPFDFGVDMNIYHPAPGLRAGHLRIAFYARPSTPRRAYELGIEALAIVKQRLPSAEIVLYGAENVPPPPFAFTNAGLLNPWELAKLFASCDIGLVLSTTNLSLMPLEMMACRCAVVDLASERVEWLLEDGVNCRLAAPEAQAIADAILDLAWHPEARAEIVETAFKLAQAMKWQRAGRQLEAVLLRHAPPAERAAAKSTSGGDAEMLSWQIHQLLDAGGDQAELIDALRSALYRTLAEKALLVQHIQAVEQQRAAEMQASAWGKAQSAAGPLADKLLDAAPAALLEGAPASKLSLTQEPLCQVFVADRSHLRRIELRLAPLAAVHTGSLRVSLYEGEGQTGRLVTSEVLRAAELPVDAPCAVDFAVQPDSYGKIYTLCLSSGEAQRQPPGVWHLRQAQLEGAGLRRNGELLAGQLALQPFYGEHEPLLPPRRPLRDWNEHPRPFGGVVRAAAARQGQEMVRLARETQRVLRERGAAGLLREVLNYVQWQLSQRG